MNPELTAVNPEEQPLTMTEKRRRGRPKGSKNGPNAGTTGRPVGRPRKDGSIRVPKERTGELQVPICGCASANACLSALSRSTTAGVGSDNRDDTIVTASGTEQGK